MVKRFTIFFFAFYAFFYYYEQPQLDWYSSNLGKTATSPSTSYNSTATWLRVVTKATKTDIDMHIIFILHNV